MVPTYEDYGKRFYNDAFLSSLRHRSPGSGRLRASLNSPHFLSLLMNTDPLIGQAPYYLRAFGLTLPSARNTIPRPQLSTQ